MFGLVVRFELRDEEAAAGFDQLVNETVSQIRALEPGTLVYLVHSVEDSSLSRVFYELYADRDAFNVHETQPHTRRFLDERARYLSDVRVEFMTLTGGKGVPLDGG